MHSYVMNKPSNGQKSVIFIYNRLNYKLRFNTNLKIKFKSWFKLNLFYFHKHKKLKYFQHQAAKALLRNKTKSLKPSMPPVQFTLIHQLRSWQKTNPSTSLSYHCSPHYFIHKYSFISLTYCLLFTKNILRK